MNLNCLECHTRMVQHECVYVCLLCEKRVGVEDWDLLADLAEDYLKLKRVQIEGAKQYNDV